VKAAKVINGVKKDTNATGGGQMLAMINNITGAENDDSNGANAAFDVIPAGKKVGDTWSDSSITEEIKTYRNYSFKEVNGKKCHHPFNGQTDCQKESGNAGYGSQCKF
jgi:hypothetical protein